jgi:hypothetical protein
MMERDIAYRRLLDDLCQHANLTDVEDRENFYYTADIKVNEIDFSLMPGGDDNAGALLFFCDFGPVPLEFEALAMRRLLEANLAMMGAGRPGFGINFTTEHVLLSGAVQIAGMNGEQLLEMLRHYASKALDWRENYFLLDQERQRPNFSSPDRGHTTRLLQRAQKNS